jgi:hypothetical protein
MMEQRYFVHILAHDLGALQKLNAYGFDLFPHTARKKEKSQLMNPFSNLFQ